MVIAGKSIAYSRNQSIADTDWSGCDLVIDGTQVKVYAWYDNEWGYVNRMMDIAAMIAAQLGDR